MTDIETARDRVIEAARAWRAAGGGRPTIEAAAVLVKAIDALDAAEQPDPWSLLAEVINADGVSVGVLGRREADGIDGRIVAALEWKQQQDGGNA